ncbi:hypothetical protein BJY52DRAFT_1230699 [Lactarius psammicola]|nr:hypothetical protein BJY52DRAFT_1230699 [Lactarius psammicola]
MPRKPRITQARTRRAEMDLVTLKRVSSHQSGREGTLTQWTETDSGEDLDPELASFCQKFDLEPQVQDFESDADGDDTPGSDADHDPSNEPEIAEQSELEHFSAVLQRAQQIAIWLEKEEVRNTQESKTRAMEQAT